MFAYPHQEVTAAIMRHLFSTRARLSLASARLPPRSTARRRRAHRRAAGRGRRRLLQAQQAQQRRVMLAGLAHLQEQVLRARTGGISLRLPDPACLRCRRCPALHEVRQDGTSAVESFTIRTLPTLHAGMRDDGVVPRCLSRRCPA